MKRTWMVAIDVAIAVLLVGALVVSAAEFAVDVRADDGGCADRGGVLVKPSPWGDYICINRDALIELD